MLRGRSASELMAERPPAFSRPLTSHRLPRARRTPHDDRRTGLGDRCVSRETSTLGLAAHAGGICWAHIGGPRRDAPFAEAVRLCDAGNEKQTREKRIAVRRWAAPMQRRVRERVGATSLREPRVDREQEWTSSRAEKLSNWTGQRSATCE